MANKALVFKLETICPVLSEETWILVARRWVPQLVPMWVPTLSHPTQSLFI